MLNIKENSSTIASSNRKLGKDLKKAAEDGNVLRLQAILKARKYHIDAVDEVLVPE